jgi:hypothetical protein
MGMNEGVRANATVFCDVPAHRLTRNNHRIFWKSGLCLWVLPSWPGADWDKRLFLMGALIAGISEGWSGCITA